MNPELGGQFGNYHKEIHIDGLSGVLPTMPMAFRERARAQAAPALVSGVAGGAGAECTQRAGGHNRETLPRLPCQLPKARTYGPTHNATRPTSRAWPLGRHFPSR